AAFHSCPPALPFSRTAPHVFSLLSLVPLNPTPHPIFPTPSLLPILSPMPPPPRNDGSRDSDTSPAFHLPQLVFSPVDLEEPPFARHRGRAAATTRGLPLAGAPSFSTTRHQQRRMTPPSTPSHDVQPLTPPETLARIGQRAVEAVEGRGGPWRSYKGRIERAHTPPFLGGRLAAGARQLRGRGGG
uniref:Uncharacterized protein n=1 Tax=Aegilops tauschii subsp. strangulata TaxID=200361 RepID=A0A452Y955_AEGTS